MTEGEIGMKIDKEEKRSLKRSFIGLFVIALLGAMVLFGNIGTIVAKAEGESILETEVLANATPVSVGTTEEFNTVMQDVMLGKYAYGVIIQLQASLDFGMQTITLPAYPVGIDMGGYSITNVGSIGETKAEAEVGYAAQLFVSGTENAVFSFSGETVINDDGTTEQTLAKWYVMSGVKVVFSSVDVQNVRIIAEPGSAFGYNSFYHELPVADDINTERKEVIYDSSYGAGLYRQSSASSSGDEITYYVDALYIKDGVNTLDVTTAYGRNCKYRYTAEAVAAIPAGVTLTYDNNYFTEEYTKPENPFIVDNTYGVYTVADNNKTMTIYAAAGWGRSTYVSTNNNEISLVIQGNYTSTTETGTEEVQCKKVIYAEGAIPESGNYAGEDKKISQAIILESNVNNILIYGIDFEFQMSSHSEFQIFNQTHCAVNVVDTDNQTKVWVQCNELDPNTDYGIMGISIEEIPTSEDYIYSGESYVEAGTKVLLSPEIENSTIYGIQFGNYTYIQNEADPTQNYYSYANGRRVDSDSIRYFTNGSVEITIPNFSASFTASTGTIEGTLDYEIDGTILKEEPIDNDIVNYWFAESFELVVPAGFEICEADKASADDTGWVSENLTVSEEGQAITKEFYVIDKTMIADEKDIDDDTNTTEEIPADTYGKISTFSYIYTLDIASPVITSITATDEAGNILELNGGWYEAGEAVSDIETVWTNQPVTLEAIADEGTGLALAGYEFDGVLQTENTYMYSDEGVYDIQVRAKDEFDIATDRETGVWASNLGIDVSAPVLGYTDANNASSMPLRSYMVFEGNVHVVVMKEDSGVDQINLYKEDGTACNELLIKMDSGYTILPTAEDVVYRMEITDVAGNTGIYENLILLGYEQDVTFTIGTSTGVYGKALEIPVTITNTGKNKLEITSLTLREDATDGVFGNTLESTTELDAGGTFTTTLTIPNGTDAGKYEAMIDMAYTSVVDDASQCIAKAYSHPISAAVEQAEGSAVIDIADAKEGEELSVVKTSDTNGTENVTLYYKLADADDSTYTTTVPTAAGNYMVKAVFAGTTNYKEVVVTDTFIITSVIADDDTSTEIPSDTETPTEPQGPILIQLQTGPIRLEKGISYKLESGTWKVSGDATNYAGGITFYVSESGDYTFTKQ